MACGHCFCFAFCFTPFYDQHHTSPAWIYLYFLQGENVHLAKSVNHARGVCWYSSWAAGSYAPSHTPSHAPTPRPTGTRYPSSLPTFNPSPLPTQEPTWVYNSILFAAGGDDQYGLMKYVEASDTYVKMSQLEGERVTSIVVDRRRDQEPMVSGCTGVY